MKKILAIKNLNKKYHTLTEEIIALKNITFDVYEGEFISIVGPSGCGKSTILSILCNLVNKSEGEIIKDKDISVAYMLQDDCLLPYKTVLSNCLIGLELNNKLNEESKNYVINLLKKYGIGDFINKYPSSLSGGMKQRVALIRTLATNPDILLLDEPLSALDSQSRLLISNDLYNIIKSENKTAIMVTHDINEAISMSDKIIVLSNRPSIVKNVYNINLEGKSNPINNRKLKDFNKYFDLIWRDLDVQI